MGCCIDPVMDLVEIGQYAGASLDQLLRITFWLATSMTGRQDDVAMVPADQGPLTWAPVPLSVSNIEFDDSCLRAEVRMHCSFTAASKDGLTRIERDGGLIGTVTQGRFRLLEAEYKARGPRNCNGVVGSTCATPSRDGSRMLKNTKSQGASAHINSGTGSGWPWKPTVS
jgi:hypothetical protein